MHHVREVEVVQDGTVQLPQSRIIGKFDLSGAKFPIAPFCGTLNRVSQLLAAEETESTAI